MARSPPPPFCDAANLRRIGGAMQGAVGRGYLTSISGTMADGLKMTR